ncbi:MAG: hypothetical protein QM831_21500 [Kofleriaceae bacterium]
MRSLLVLGLLASTASAGDDDLLPPPPQLSAPAAPTTAPKLSIVSPKMDEVKQGKRTKAADDRYDTLDCLQDAKTLSVKIAAENWSVKPGGQGVLLIVDGVYATVLHDLAKPVLVADLEPYEHDTFSGSDGFASKYPMYNCGYHWIAVMPVAANGHMLRVPPTVSWWKNVSDNPKDESHREEDAGEREARLSNSLPIVNWPLLGKPYIGRTWSQTEHDHRSGRVLADAKHIVFDYTIAMGVPERDRPRHDDECALRIAAQNEMQSWTNELELPPTGTVELPKSYVNNALALNEEKCGGLSPYFAMLWAKEPSAGKKLAWPVPGSAQAEDYWHSAAGHKQFKQHVKSQREKCDKGEGDCQYGHTK